MQDNIRALNDDRKRYDKRAIAEALANSSDKDELVCGFIDSGIVDECSKCTVRDICAGLDYIVEDQRRKNNKVVDSFTFE